MHKTKGTGIPDVIVVLDEYYWRDYDFRNILTQEFGDTQKMDRKLVYVACSRAIRNLTCVRIISAEEEKALAEGGFCTIQKINYDEL